MASTIVGMPIRQKLRDESADCRVSDTISEITPDKHEVVNRHIEVDGLTVCEKRLH